MKKILSALFVSLMLGLSTSVYAGTGSSTGADGDISANGTSGSTGIASDSFFAELLRYFGM